MGKYAEKYGFEYSLNELFHELINDPSWEADPAVRERIARSIWAQVANRQPLLEEE
jgi:hypothetical protein